MDFVCVGQDVLNIIAGYSRDLHVEDKKKFNDDFRKNAKK